jgi:hypothetical protein
MARMPCSGSDSYGRGPMVLLAPSHRDRVADSDLSELGNAIYLVAVARVL